MLSRRAALGCAGLSQSVFFGCASVRSVQCDGAARNFRAVGKVRQRVAVPVDGSEIDIQAGDMFDVAGFELVNSVHEYSYYVIGRMPSGTGYFHSLR